MAMIIDREVFRSSSDKASAFSEFRVTFNPFIGNLPGSLCDSENTNVARARESNIGDHRNGNE